MNGWGRPREQARLLELVAAACLGSAVGFAAWSFGLSLATLPRGALSLAAAGLAFAAAYGSLVRFAGPRSHPIPDFAVTTLEQSDLMARLQDLLAEATAADAGAGELLLEDALEAPAADSRVVQLFQPGPMPTAGELQARIDRHLGERGEDGGPLADDSGELFEALASLKRSLR